MTDEDNVNQKGELLRKVKTRRDKILKFDGEAEDGELITWFVAYRGKYGWVASRGTGEWTDRPTDDEVEWAFDEYDHSQIISRSELPEGINLTNRNRESEGKSTQNSNDPICQTCKIPINVKRSDGSIVVECACRTVDFKRWSK